MRKDLILCTVIFILIVMSFNKLYAEPIKIINPIDISGKVFDRSGNLFTEQLEVDVDLISGTIDFATAEQAEERTVYKVQVQGGPFPGRGKGPN